jgi:hypothetical protein
MFQCSVPVFYVAASLALGGQLSLQSLVARLSSPNFPLQLRYRLKNANKKNK